MPRQRKGSCTGCGSSCGQVSMAACKAACALWQHVWPGACGSLRCPVRVAAQRAISVMPWQLVGSGACGSLQ
eukprot:1162131-Pelagomonas_calceolata.AAC.3